ncbi:threonylcarbamoyl-AMP synthase [Epidermidibacterium keratini]|uniref:Threonylcarbamoyl-AMP synthase n=1 Tax=Epidermidibacterium keratini TaxID=1891644 RepID=A0A7L4YM58_9ACTN|nr:L-threonylcarbamoyladenylate synthase [Epidermidibacterium keratini]QHC00365.1 threonylcarbamoyl-AMP synthase [Epidermidibacterium keratini]
MAQLIDIHPQDPQPRLIAKAADIIRDGGLIAYPTDSSYALGCSLGNKEALQRIRDIRHLDDRHDFTLVCSDFSQMNAYVAFDNSLFRVLKNATPGPYTFIMQASRETPRVMQNPKKKTVGVRIPDHPVALALIAELGTPVVSSTLLLPDRDEQLLQGWEVRDELDYQLDAVIDGESGYTPTTVVDVTSGVPEVVRVGAGDPTPFE